MCSTSKNLMEILEEIRSESVDGQVGTSMITLAVPAGAGAVVTATRLLTRETGVSSNIKV